MEKRDYLIIGGGIAGTTAAEEIRTHDSSASVAIITKEPDRLYSRVRLPHYLRNENNFESLYVRTPESYQQKNIGLITDQEVVRLETDKKQVTTKDGQIFIYEKLLLASGGKVNELQVPKANLPEILSMHTLVDVKKARQIIDQSSRAVVYGSGFIAVEFAQTFVTNQIETTLIMREGTIWEKILGQKLGQVIEAILKTKGIRVIPETEITEFIGGAKLEAVKTNSGQILPTDTVGLGIGISRELAYLNNSDVATKKGVVTNEYLETSVPNIWAAGDIAEFYDPNFKRYHLLGNWANASSQGRTAGLNLVGKKSVFETNSLYSINIFDNNLTFLGDLEMDENTEILVRGSLEDKKLGRFFFRNDCLVGAALINLPLERGILTKLIKTRTKITANQEKLKDLNFDLGTLVN